MGEDALYLTRDRMNECTEEGGRKGRAVRRVVHMAICLSLIYYILPVELPWFGLRRWVLLIGFFAVIAAVETVRLKRKVTFYGLRKHERSSIASFLWAAAGITLTLWCFPHDIAGAAIIGTAFIDPLLGELRLLKMPLPAKVGIPQGAYFLIAFAVLTFNAHWTFPQTILLSAAGALSAIPSEWVKVRYVDDDFLMMTVPGLVMAWLTLAF